MSKHTPGPWEFGKDGAIEYNNVQNYIVGADGTLIVYGQVKDADARLIAAAPDLLEALKAIVGIDAHSILTEADADAIHQQSRAAIAKATGENQ